jgi:DNA-binding NarL/FixJ family response regulator
MAGELHLSPREREVVDLVAQGMMQKQIADRLGIAPGTVSVYVSRVGRKLPGADTPMRKILRFVLGAL